MRRGKSLHSGRAGRAGFAQAYSLFMGRPMNSNGQIEADKAQEIDCKDRHVWFVRDFDYPSGRLVHKCRRCGAEKTTRALFMRHDMPWLYKRWRS